MVTEIEDSGRGIAPEIAGQLFEAFATHGKAHGTGLGLSICKRIIEDHQGWISARNQPGRGAVFSFGLPRRRMRSHEARGGLAQPVPLRAMNRIRLLPEQVANQIAAGEVVERPASVVKELVENSLDAQAARVTVEIQAGGRSLIRVADDGLGMSRDDALLCLERHATSKIRRAEDLAAIATMGFRGEALPSIASVSRFTLTTRERDSDSPEGTQIVISGGKILEVKAAGSAPGTTVEVRQLFFNLPARRKFLRTEETESAHIQHYLTLAALAYPEVAFTFQKDGRLVWQLPAVKTGSDTAARLAALRERLRALYGGEQKLLAVDFSAELRSPDDVRGPATLRSDSGPRPRPFASVGFHRRAGRLPLHPRRPAPLRQPPPGGESRAEFRAARRLSHRADERALPGLLPVPGNRSGRRGREHPPGQARGEVPSGSRGAPAGGAGGPADAARISRRASLSPEARRPRVHGPPSAAVEPAGRPASSASRAVRAAEFPGGAEARASATSRSRSAQQPPLRMGFSPAPPTPDRSPIANRRPQPSSPQRALATPATQCQPPPLRHPAEPVPLLNVPLRLVGVIGRLYVVLESDRGLVLLDQHAAHERILFEQMLNRLEQNDQAPSQRLLLPETVELSARDASFLREQLPALTRLGVGLSEFGERTFLLDALPPFVKAPDARRFVLELVDELKAAGQELNSLRLGEHTVAKTVCRHAVKANDPLAGRELESLVEDLRHCAMPYTCPHGRPTLIEMNFRELEKKFGRTQ